MGAGNQIVVHCRAACAPTVSLPASPEMCLFSLNLVSSRQKNFQVALFFSVWDFINIVLEFYLTYEYLGPVPGLLKLFT